ncbi:MAG TPA: HNH endonuclease [Myxococcales bacterium]
MTTTARIQAGRLADLLRRERAELAEFLLALAEFDEQRGWLELGHSSLFDFLHRELGLSRGAAHYRKTAAGLVRQFPEIVEPLRDGRLCITSVVEVAKVLTVENRHEVLPRFFRRSRRDAMALAAALQPSAAPHREVITAARPAPAALTAFSSPRVTGSEPEVQPVEPGSGAVQPVEPGSGPVQPVEPHRAGSAPAAADGGTDAPRAARRRASHSAEPLTAELSRLHLTVSRRFLDKLKAARAALSHTEDGADAASILEAGLDLVLKRHAARRGLAGKPRAETATAESAGAIPASVKREVWKRDGGQCQWPLDSGGTCQSTLRVEYDHIIPRALGGSSAPGNLRLLCRFHNDLAARRTLGAEWMNQFTRDPARPMRPPRS